MTALVALLATAVVWGVFGSISNKVEGQGIFVRKGGLKGVISPHYGEVADVAVQVGDLVVKGQIVVTLFRSAPKLEDQVRYVVSPHSGRVVEVMVNNGNFVKEGARVLNLEPLDAELNAIVYMPPSEGKRVAPDMAVQLAPATIKPEEYGYMLGRVTSISPFPRTQDGMVRVLGAEEFAKQFSKAGQPYEIAVQLVTDPGSPTGYRWTSQGPDAKIESGTLCAAKVIVEQQPPIRLVIPLIKKQLGLY